MAWGTYGAIQAEAAKQQAKNTAWGSYNKPSEQIINHVTPEYINKCLDIPQYDENDNLLHDTINVAVTQIGDLAVLDSVTALDCRIVHVPTLVKFDTALPERPRGTRYSKKMLLTWCATVQSSHKEAWEALAKLEDYSVDIPEKRVILNLCQSTPVGKEPTG